MLYSVQLGLQTVAEVAAAKAIPFILLQLQDLLFGLPWRKYLFLVFDLMCLFLAGTSWWNSTEFFAYCNRKLRQYLKKGESILSEALKGLQNTIILLILVSCQNYN